MQETNEFGDVKIDEAFKIDFDSAIPFYYQLKQFIKKMIESEQWKPGQNIPSENEFCEIFNVSRTVVRQALLELETDQQIEVIKGKGRYVSKKKQSWQLMASLKGFYEDAVASGQKVDTKVLEQKDIPATDEIANFLRIKPGEIVTKLKRLRFIDGEPILVVTTYTPKKLCPTLVDVDFSKGSLYQYLREEYGFVISEGIRTIESINASREVASLLAVKTGAALSLLKSVGWLDDGTPLEYYIAWHRGDKSRFQVRLVRNTT